MFHKIVIILGLSIFAVMKTYAQQIWSLQDCIDYAIAHSVQKKRLNNAAKYAKQELNNARYNMLPSLSGTCYQDFSFGRGLSAENIYTSTDVRTTAIAIAAELPVFTGFRITNTIKQKRHLYYASLYDMQKAEDELRINVITAYQDVLYKQEDMLICYRQFVLDSTQTERIRVLMQKGKSSKIDFVRQSSAKSQSKAKHLQAVNALRMAKLTLAQLMELPSPDSLRLAIYDSPIEKMQIERPEAVFESTVSNKTEIKAEEHRIKAHEHKVKIFQSSLYPTLSLTGGIGSKYYLMPCSFNVPFDTQMKNNLSEYVTLNMSIPIFNRFETRSSIRKARIELDDQRLALEETKKELYKAIQQAYYKALDAQNCYAACKESSVSAEESLSLVIAKYENGLVDISEYNEALKTYSETLSKLTQAKYEFIFAVEILNFYKGTNNQTQNERRTYLKEP